VYQTKENDVSYVEYSSDRPKGRGHPFLFPLCSLFSLFSFLFNPFHVKQVNNTAKQQDVFLLYLPSLSFFLLYSPILDIMISVPTNYLTATETLQFIKKGKLIAEQVIADHKQRYEERNEKVRAWVTVDYEAATQAAKDTKGLPLHGVMIAVKDIISTSDPDLCSRYV
jgi:hypothetical protein